MARILIIDDSVTEVTVLSRLLQRYGHEILTASDGQTGITTACIELPDLILMDVVMPGTNGFQATRQLSRTAETAAIPVFIISAKDQETDRAWGLRQGARDYLVKPVSEAQLIAKISTQLDTPSTATDLSAA